jgi:hypothetical protein
MAKVITFSQSFPAYHPKAGKETFFVQKFLTANRETVHFNPNEPTHFYPDPQDLFELNKHLPHDLVSKFVHKIDGYSDNFEPKQHTIRSGNRFKKGEKFSPRVWSGQPYNSKQIIIGEDTEILKLYDFEIKIVEVDGGFASKGFVNDVRVSPDKLMTIAENDGLELADFLAWFQFPKSFKGQIICWNEKINY